MATSKSVATRMLILVHIFRLAKVRAFLLSISLEVEPLGHGVYMYSLEEIQAFFTSSQLILIHINVLEPLVSGSRKWPSTCHHFPILRFIET